MILDIIEKLKIVLLFLATIILTIFTFVFTANAEQIIQRPSIDTDGYDKTNQNGVVLNGVRFNGQYGKNVTTLYAYYQHRLNLIERRYTLAFWVWNEGSMPYATLNGQPCTTQLNLTQIQNSGNYNAWEQVQGSVWLISCVNIAPNTQQFYLRLGNLNPSTSYTKFYGIGEQFYIDSYPSESASINGAVGQIQEALIQNNNTNTSNIVNSVTNMTNTLNQQQQQTNQKLDQINNTISDSSVDSFDVQYSNDVGPISGLITMPITLARGYLNGINSSCQPYNLGLLFNQPLILPCVQPQRWLGANLYNVIDILFSGFMIYSLSKLFIRTFNKITNLNNEKIEEELYSND